MKGGGGGERKGRSRLPQQEPSSQLLRRVSSVVVGCFLFVLVFLLSSRGDVVVFDALSLPKTSLRTPSPAADAETVQSSAGHDSEDGATTSTTAAVVRTNGVEGEAEPEVTNAAALTSNSDDRRASPGAAADEPGPDNAVHVTPAAVVAAQPAVGTTPPQPELSGNTGVTTTTRADPVKRQQRPRKRKRKRKPLCDFSGPRADVCDLEGDVRLDANATALVVVVDDDDPAAVGANNGTPTTYRVRPYPRKGDATAMGRVTELTVRTTTAAGAESAPRCTSTHAAPAVVFSAGGYAGNLFHDFTDVIVPLYGAAKRYGRDVRLVVADADPRWMARYGALLRGLSRHAPLDLARAGATSEVHCFPRAVVTPRAGRELLIDERDGAAPTMPDFGRFLRRALALPRDAPTRLSTNKKPRLLIISRRGTRKILNIDAVSRAVEAAGFEATSSELDPSSDIAEVGRLINSYDAVVGVHGAGLTNMVFLPPGATVVQIVPWGGLRWIAQLDFGDPAEAMGLRYVQYEVGVEETTLKDKYPRDHEVFTNPTALHKKGFGFMRRTFLNGQDIIVDVDRFRAVLIQARNSLAR